MSDQGKTCLVLVALIGCFGAPAMHYDIQDYNKAAVSSEKEMLLFNIGALYYRQPPHFMMLLTISQSRTFSAMAGFQWTNPASWQVPFTEEAIENPTIQFVPIQGGDFVQRFESRLTDKLTLLLEDRRATLFASEQNEQDKELITLLAQSVILLHGGADTSKCNRWDHSDGTYVNNNAGYKDFSACVNEIVTAVNDYEMVDGHHLIPTKASEGPKAADLVSALTPGYEWTAQGDQFALTNPVRVPAWFDYSPEFVAAPPESGRTHPSEPVFWQWPRGTPPDWRGMQYKLPKDYEWKKYNDSTRRSHYVYALLPKGYDLARDKNGRLRVKYGQYYPVKTPAEASTHDAIGSRTQNSPRIVGTAGTISASDLDRGIVGIGIPPNTLIVAVDANTATMSRTALSSSSTTMRVGDVDQFSYADNVVGYVWPVPQDYFYFELRKGEVDGATAQRVCFPKTKLYDFSNHVVCGFFKIGTLLDTMQRLADMACNHRDRSSIDKYCQQSIFGIGDIVPSWADNSAPYYRVKGPFVWVPAHNPTWNARLADRDRRAFLDLYKLYQMSLVDTSKLVTGIPPITISK